MTVIADTSPLNYLVLVGKETILPRLYGRVVCPDAVITEMLHKDAPPEVRVWAAYPPVWIEVIKPSTNDPSLEALGNGEREAICLTIELAADLLLIDERAGRQAAVERGLKIAGTLAVLEEAAQKGLLDFRSTFIAIRQAGFSSIHRCRCRILETKSSIEDGHSTLILNRISYVTATQ